MNTFSLFHSNVPPQVRIALHSPVELKAQW
ncbi:MAG: hypothetical protein ACI8R0_002522 [Alteromonadales bacterium]